jgi:hypothetical protein
LTLEFGSIGISSSFTLLRLPKELGKTCGCSNRLEEEGGNEREDEERWAVRESVSNEQLDHGTNFWSTTITYHSVTFR